MISLEQAEEMYFNYLIKNDFKLVFNESISYKTN